MTSRRLYKFALIATIVLFLGAAALSVAGVTTVAIALVAFGLAASVAASHLRSRLLRSHSAKQAKNHDAILAATTALALDNGKSGDSSIAAAVSEISAMTSRLELNLGAHIASSESVLLADLLTLRHRVNSAVEYAESSLAALDELRGSQGEFGHPPADIQELGDGGS